MLYPTTSRVYFYIPADKEGYTKPRIIPHTLTGILLYTRNNQGTSHATTTYNHMGILLYTHKHRGLHKTSELSPHPRGYTFIYPQTRTDATSRKVPHPRGYTFIYPQTKRVTQNLGSFPTPSRVYFYIPATS